MRARPAGSARCRLALRVAALAAVCFIAVAAYTLFDSDRTAKAKAGRIAEILARNISLQQSQAQWLSVSMTSPPDLQGIAALMEPGLCIAYRDTSGRLHELWREAGREPGAARPHRRRSRPLAGPRRHRAARPARGGAVPGPGSGLRGLADRVDTLGGRLRVDHVDGGGTRLVAELPCGS